LIIGIFALVVCLGAGGCERRPDPGTPNVLLITVDTLRADYLGCYGHPEVKTPNIDRLAAEGVNFRNNVAPSQCTNPAHASIFTGLYLAFHGVYDNQTPLAEEALTMAEILRQRDYKTLGAVSARHLNTENANFTQGFDEFLECEPVEITAEERNHKFLKKLRKAASRSFFAWVHYYDPHGDYVPPSPYDTMYPVGAEYDPVPGKEVMDLSEEKKSGPVDPDEIIPLYKGEISYLDHHIGRLLDLLDELEIADDTLVILVADHGESMTEQGIYFCHAGLYNQTTHVPLILRFPGRIRPGLEFSGMTSSVDVLPTVLDLLGFELRGSALDGRSLVPALTDPDYQPHEFVIVEAVDGIIGALYQAGYKYLKPYGDEWSVTEDHLFRPFEDYWETQDLKHKEAERARQMESFLDSWLQAAKQKSLPSVRREKLDKKTEEALKSLGYIK
jgi:arylsulfatase A-like enzyme